MVVREIIRTFVRKITESYMKKSSNDIVRSLFLMAAMIIIGAGSAFAQSETQSENDYFSLTKNAVSSTTRRWGVPSMMLTSGTRLRSSKTTRSPPTT